MTTPDYLIVFAFLAGIFFVGSIFYRWIGSSDDFYLAGRNLTPFILAAVIAATNINLYSFIGQSGIAFQSGISIIWQTWTGNMALVFSGLFVIPIFRRLRIRTIPEFLEIRYSKGVRTLVAVVWIFVLTFWIGVILYASITAAQIITGIDSFFALALALSVVVVTYTMLGGMWSVALTDVLQFVLLLSAALILLPLAMGEVGWWPVLVQKLPEGSLTLIRESGPYSWQFILAILFLGIQWACTDQGLLQRAFGAKDTRTVARSLVLAGIITTPFALLWIIPGLAARVLHPGLVNPDTAVPTLLITLIPHVLLGVVVVGLFSSQLSATSGNLNGIATVVASDIYESLFNRKASQDRVIFVARVITVVAGAAMIGFAYCVPLLGGAVRAYLTVIAIMNMPLFVITIVYGLLWKRANWQGAIAGYVGGVAAGVIAQFWWGIDFNTTTYISGGVTLVLTPVVSLLTRQTNIEDVERIWKSRNVSDEELRANDVYSIIPTSTAGRLSLGLLVLGFLVFLAGVISGSQGFWAASILGVTGMIFYFIGGLLRTMTD
jgi:solute:Na+ symporter, SSS family